MAKQFRTKKLWGNRFSKEASALAEAFTSGRDVRGVPPADERLVPYDLWGSRAHVVMLARQGVIPRREARLLGRELRRLGSLWERGEFRLDPSKEDVHSNIESVLTLKHGIDVGGRVHTARSRNDQIALDMRLYLRDCALDFVQRILLLAEALVEQAWEHAGLILPGYTHHQPAQVTTLGHVYLGFTEALLRDGDRFRDWYARFNRNPLGSMTGYGTSFPIDRNLTSRLLGFDGPCGNSLDPVQTRWEPEAEMGFGVAALMNHLSSLAQTLILLSTGEFAMIRLDDAYCSGSSMMPQKRNADTLEVMKAKAAAAQGMLAALLSLGRALFMGYNRDTQWTKYLILDMVDECLPAPQIMAEILVSLEVKEERMAALSRRGFIASPDLAEYLVQKFGLPFRQAKGLVESAVKYAEEEGLEEVSFAALQKAMKEEGLGLKVDEQNLLAVQDPRFIVSRRRGVGGTSPQALEKDLCQAIRSCDDLLGWLLQRRKQQSAAKFLLERMEGTL